MIKTTPKTSFTITRPVMFSRSAIIGLLSMGLFASHAAVSETIEIPVGQQAPEHWEMDRPIAGMSKAQVEKKYGEPEKRYAAVGEPPISRWEYADYIVVFEYSTVLHTVLKQTPGAAQ